ncbi:MAG: tol-pal system protein YbgF [Magnetococcales bacterium]|nr:tol-pal system protein YbgF [Magnetococcales bacterium]|tara:strand:+ start:1055 stop:1921 length:867 start_codon:yes stop_codon:yes gene_type:complete
MKKIVSGIAILSALVVTNPAFSQEDTEVGKLKERLMALEQKIYSNPAQEKASSGTLMADFQVRLSNLEEESQKVYGAVEELGFTVNEFAKKMDLISKDFDLRLTDLESAIHTLKNQSPGTPKSDDKVQNSSQKKTEAKPATKKVEPVKAKESASTSSVPSDISSEDLYSKAYQFLVATAYDDSEAWMKEFIKRFPSHDLADNAHYWLGEIYLVKDMPEQAVVSFSTGLSKFPKGAKAPANLLKMGSAFKEMGKKDFAESSWKKLVKDYKDSPEADKALKELEALKAEG